MSGKVELVEFREHHIWNNGTSIEGNPAGVYHWSMTLQSPDSIATRMGLIAPRPGATEGDVMSDLMCYVRNTVQTDYPNNLVVLNYRLVENRQLA